MGCALETPFSWKMWGRLEQSRKGIPAAGPTGSSKGYPGVPRFPCRLREPRPCALSSLLPP